MRKTLTALVIATAIALATVATSSTADARRGWWGPAIAGGFVAGAIIGSQIANPYPSYYRYPGPVYYEYSTPGPGYYEVYGPPPAPVENCWGWRQGYRYRVC